MEFRLIRVDVCVILDIEAMCLRENERKAAL